MKYTLVTALAAAGASLAFQHRSTAGVRLGAWTNRRQAQAGSLRMIIEEREETATSAASVPPRKVPILAISMPPTHLQLPDTQPHKLLRCLRVHPQPVTQ